MITVGICRINNERILPFSYASARDAINFFMPVSCDTAITMAIERNDLELFHEAVRLGIPKDDVKIYDSVVNCTESNCISHEKACNYDYFTNVLEWLDEKFGLAVEDFKKGLEGNEDKETV